MLMPYRVNDNSLVLDNQYILRVRDLPQEEKPREKMLHSGPQGLSVHELLAIVMNVGTKKEDVMSMSVRLLKEYGAKSIISQTDPRKLSSELNIPFVKACQIIACFELGRRFFQKIPHALVIVRNAKETYEYLKDMGSLPKEQLRGIYLNSHYRIVHDEVISLGSLNANMVHPREVFKPALDYSAVAVIIAHNHPSGVAKPSSADIEITKQLVQAGKILGVDLLDHLIITNKQFVSIDINH